MRRLVVSLADIPVPATYCNNCGGPVDDGNALCLSCRTMGDASLGPRTELVAVVHEPDRPGAGLRALAPLAGFATLVVPSGTLAGSRFILNDEVTTLGRDVGSDIFLDDVTVSRSHARLSRQEGRFVLEDQGSLNGTYINGLLVDRADLLSGDELRVGKFKLVFLFEPTS